MFTNLTQAIGRILSFLGVIFYEIAAPTARNDEHNATIQRVHGIGEAIFNAYMGGIFNSMSKTCNLFYLKQKAKTAALAFVVLIFFSKPVIITIR